MTAGHIASAATAQRNNRAPWEAASSTQRRRRWHCCGTSTRGLGRVVALSLYVSGTACVIASVFGMALGAWLAVARFPGRRVVIALLNTLLALPSVVVGLVVYLLLSRAGPLGSLGILFTPAAMIVAQTILVLPVVAALTRQLIADAWHGNGEQLRSMGARPAGRRRPAAAARAPGAGDGAAHRLRPRHQRSRCGDDRRRQHRRRDARDDDHHRARNQQGRSAARARPGPGAARRGRPAQCADRAGAAPARRARRRRVWPVAPPHEGVDRAGRRRRALRRHTLRSPA